MRVKDLDIILSEDSVYIGNLTKTGKLSKNAKEVTESDILHLVDWLVNFKYDGNGLTFKSRSGGEIRIIQTNVIKNNIINETV